MANRYKRCRICRGPIPNVELEKAKPICDGPECVTTWSDIRRERERKYPKPPQEPLSDWPEGMNFADNVRTVCGGRLGLRPARVHGGSSAAWGIALAVLLLVPHAVHAQSTPSTPVTSGPWIRPDTITIQSAIKSKTA